MLVACRLAGLSALKVTMPSAALARNPANGAPVLPDWGATLRGLHPILAGSPHEAPDGLKAPSPPPERGTRLTGRLKGLARPSRRYQGGVLISADAFV
jgi:hypothetical protein